ncbi:motility protein B [Lentibacillus populi]|uniref:Motility protein B n=1 Tax=Lentibacillus populi TaxID=1827502 RepID=A0A9W5X523_9BACI|nr:flagellar motor protein MotB [Lentibacillus populi]GGB35730.1 motility protein B [Lentibacillus populi]
MQQKKRSKNREHKVDESWLLPYSDLLTLLLALFIVLFAMSEIDAEKYEQLTRVFKSEFSGGTGFLDDSGAPAEVPGEADKDAKETKTKGNSKNEWTQLKELQTKVDDYIANNNLEKVLETQLTGEGLLITIRNDVTFDSGSAIVKKDGRKIAAEVSKLLIADPPREVVISGHADDRPINNSEFRSNWELSVMRAVNFMSLILKNNSLDPTMFSAKGFGEHQPIVPNSSEENRAKNRRVEVLVLPNTEIDVKDSEKADE